MSPHPDKDGYLRLRMRLNGSYVNRLVHRLVAEAFKGPCPDGLVCAHRDGDVLNNSVDNLVYCTQKQNIHHKFKHGTIVRGEAHHGAKLTESDVKAIRARYPRYMKKHGALSALGREYGVSRVTIRKVVDRTDWRHV